MPATIPKAKPNDGPIEIQKIVERATVELSATEEQWVRIDVTDCLSYDFFMESRWNFLKFDKYHHAFMSSLENVDKGTKTILYVEIE